MNYELIIKNLDKMNAIKKESISVFLRGYCDRYESQNRAAASLKGVSSATVSHMLSGKWDLIKDDMWRNVASQIGYKSGRWVAVETADFTLLNRMLDDARENGLVMGVVGSAGSGKTFAVKHYAGSHRRTYVLCCNEYWNRKLFLTELLSQMGRGYNGYTVGEMMGEVVRGLKMADNPLIILDEADKLSDQVLYFFITLYNQLEDECGIILMATDHLTKRLLRGVKLNRRGYNEIWSRIGRRCIGLNGVSSADITAVCEANGIVGVRDIDRVIDGSDGDLRRVKRLVHAIRKKQGK